MNDYFDQVERDLRAAVERKAHLPWYRRGRLPHPRALGVLLAAVIIAAPAYAAVRLIASGSPVPASQPVTPSAFNGSALQTGARMLAVRTPDPAGGLPWGMRTVATTRGVVCIQVGRVDSGSVGALGQDDAFNNDGRFHPFSPNYQSGPPCPTPDGRGHVFLSVARYGVPASALPDAPASDGGCLPPRSMPPLRSSVLPRVRRAIVGLRRRLAGGPTCPVGDLRDIFYGFLGLDAISITYTGPNGQTITTKTIGADGAYLLVFPDSATTPNNDGYTYDASLVRGPITAVHYRNGHACLRARGGCPPIGYASAAGPIPASSQVAAPVTARVEPSRSYCQDGPDEVIPCSGRVPPGSRRIDMRGAAPEVLVVVSFISRTAITNGHSYYYLQMTRAPQPDPRYLRFSEECGGGASDFGQTNSDYAKGQQVTQWFFENLSCRGIVHGNVTLVSITGPATPAPMPALRGQSVGREVGHFSFTVP
jgi:hypothetical protein